MKKNKRVEGPSFKYKVAIISDKEGEYIQNLIEAFSKVEIFSEFIHLQDLGLMVEIPIKKIFGLFKKDNTAQKDYRTQSFKNY